jgi:hypothetical protein
LPPKNICVLNTSSIKGDNLKILMTVLLSLVGTTVFAEENSCKVYDAKCVCYPAIPFEGFQIYVYEKCDSQEGSYKYGQQSYDTQEICEAEILKDKNCLSLINSN